MFRAWLKKLDHNYDSTSTPVFSTLFDLIVYYLIGLIIFLSFGLISYFIINAVEFIYLYLFCYLLWILNDFVPVIMKKIGKK